MWLKCYVRQAVVAQCGTGDRERAKGGYRSPPLQSPLPASNLAAVRFPRLHLLASGRPGYGILPFPTSGPRPCGPDLARQLRLGDADAGHNPTADIFVFH